MIPLIDIVIKVIPLPIILVIIIGVIPPLIRCVIPLIGFALMVVPLPIVSVIEVIPPPEYVRFVEQLVK